MLDRCQLLASVRVLDMGGTTSDGTGRLLADLGADVLKVEPPGGAPDRTARPTVAGVGVDFALNNANKRSTVLDPADGRDRNRFTELVDGADILVDDDRVPSLQTKYATFRQKMVDRRLAAREYTREHGDDEPDVRDWVWPDARGAAAGTAVAATVSTGGDNE